MEDHVYEEIYHYPFEYPYFHLPSHFRFIRKCFRSWVVGIHVFTFYVGSGACSIVKFTINNGTKQYILVDAGCGYNRAKPEKEYSQTVDVINHFIQKEGITRFQYILLSHFDSDHIKMLEDIMSKNKFTVGQFIYKKYEETILQR